MRKIAIERKKIYNNSVIINEKRKLAYIFLIRNYGFLKIAKLLKK